MKKISNVSDFQLLLGNESFPLCVALAILQQLRSRLLEAEFNDCILLFSDLPAVDIEECVNDSIRIFCATPKSLTFRKSSQKSTLGNDPLNLSSLTVEMQKVDIVPRLSGEELLMLLGLRPMKDDFENGHFIQMQKPKAIAIDVRPKSDYKLGALPDSINIPASNAFDAEGQLQVKMDILEAAKHKKSKVIAIVGSCQTFELTKQFAENLVKQNYHRVCILHDGIEIFRHINGILCVPE